MNNNHKNIMGPFWHPRLEVHMFDKKLGKVGYTYSTKVLLSNVWITSQVKTFLNHNTNFGHN
jgi:hypothetical protein